jgi:O-antigen ligase
MVFLFLVTLYSQIGLRVPGLEALRPAYIIGGLAIFALLIDRLLTRRGLELVWPESYLLLALAGAAGLSCVGALWTGYAVANTADLLKAVALYFLLLHTVDNRHRLHIMLWTMVLGGLFPAVGTLRNYLHGDLVEGRSAWIGIFSNPNELAYSLVILVPLVAYLASTCPLWKRILLWGVLALYIAAIYTSFSRGGMLGLLAVCMLLGFRWPSVAVRLSTVVLLAVSVAFVTYGWTRDEGFRGLSSDAGVQERLATMEAGLAMFTDHPLTGVGLGCSVIAWPLYAPQDFHTRWLVVHNTFIQALSETGLFGFLSFTFLVGAALYRGHSISRNFAERDPQAARLGLALEIALWGFVVCALSGGFVLTWFPYILIALISSAEKVVGHAAQELSTC